MLVSGELAPDATGPYEQGADYDGFGTWTRQGGGWSIWFYKLSGHWVITPTIGVIPSGPDAWWSRFDIYHPQTGLYQEVNSATGRATVAKIEP
jgi:hypothetical protein